LNIKVLKKALEAKLLISINHNFRLKLLMWALLTQIWVKLAPVSCTTGSIYMA